jgi:hypothetical protein
MDYVRRLVAVRYLNEAAIAIVPPDVGIGLRSVAARPQPAQPPAQATPQQSQQQATAATSAWTWDVERGRYRRWDGVKWVWQEWNGSSYHATCTLGELLIFGIVLDYVLFTLYRPWFLCDFSLVVICFV